MTDAVNTRELILAILLEVTEEGRYSHLVIRTVLDKYQYLEKRERAFITRVAEGTIQHMTELDYIIDCFSKVKVRKMKPVIRNILRMGVYQIKYMDSVPDSAACNESVKLAVKKGFGTLRGFVNGVLRNISRNIDSVEYPDETADCIKAYSLRYSMPEWLVKQWMADYGKEQTKQMLAAFLLEGKLTIRTNTAGITPEKLEEVLQAEGVVVNRLDQQKYPCLPYAFTIEKFDYLNGLGSFQEGLFYVQDISSMLLTEWASPKKGDYCIDVCAAPGGKAMHIAEKLSGTGHVQARDLTEYKISLIQENIDRQQLTNITACCKDATVYDANSEQSADIVIADLPCSGLGVLRKKPDIKYRVTKKNLEELAELQGKILGTVCNYVKCGGTLIYSTCTVNRMENEENVQKFVESHPEFELEKMQQIFPQEEYGDGFFLAKFIRRK